MTTPPSGSERAAREGRSPELSAQLLAEEVERCGYVVTWVHYAYFRTVVEGVVIGFWCARTDAVSAVAAMTSGRKDLTVELLRDAGFPVADSRTYYVDEWDDAAAGAFEQGPSLVVKPAWGRRGRGVTVGVATADELRTAWETATSVDPVRVVIERQVEGRELRLLVVGGRTLAVAEKRPPTLIGDGQQTVEELIDEANQRRAANRHLTAYPLELDTWRRSRLEAVGLSPTSVLEAGRRLVVDPKASLIDGGHSIDVTDAVHLSYLDLAAEVTAAFPGLGVAGIDIIVGDPTSPVAPDDAIIEVNSMPGLGPHHFPMEGRSRDVAGPIVDHTLRTVLAAR